MFMSRRITQFAFIGLSFSFIASAAQAEDFPIEMEDQLVAVCEAVKSDNRLKLNRAVKATGLNYRDLHQGLVCNGEDMLTFAATHGAEKTGALIARHANTSQAVLTAKR